MQRTRPRRSRGALLLVVGAIAACGAVALDQALSNWLSSPPLRPRLEAILAVLLFVSIYVVVIGVLSAFANRTRLIIGFLTTVLASAATVHVLKWAIGRARPRLNEGPLSFAPFQGLPDHDAFPSGHCLAVGVLAGLLAVYFGRGRWLFLALAGIVGVERIVTRWHYLSDVIAGFGLAALMIWLCRRVLGPAYYHTGIERARPHD
ncbi:MAG: phosphatase PAP2 family protein [Phycisphaerae bacterium]|jgi:membrane-associated phospholipid phosphatase|nr:phosphatase PAP2 family protein [Phycisphaerae bacterium]MCZ2400314.1 phosphatase PAP2 family protein [Phycisphaerae bacterium]NUQ49081.1 phosphatase PAP2 family protein [Phycisphaerae bacterium]